MDNSIQSQQCAHKLLALAAPERLRIVWFLRDGSRNVTEIADMIGTAMVNVSHHLAVLRNAGIVSGEKVGRYVFYSLTPGFLERNNLSESVEYLNLGCCRLEIPRRLGFQD